MSRSNSRVIAVTMGDPCGVGPEVTAAALEALYPVKGYEFVLIGNEDVFRRYCRKKAASLSFIHVAGDDKAVHRPGKPSAAAGLDALLYLQQAVKLIRTGGADALVTAPVSKEWIIPFSPGFKGHTTFLAHEFSCDHVEMLFVAGQLRVVLATRHVPVKELSELVTAVKVYSVVKATASFLRERYHIKRPRIAVCGLNPHAGEGGHMGREEITRIIPAIKKLRVSGLDVRGPFPADTVFEPHVREGYDLIVSMYHDQALPFLKASYFDRLVNVTVGLPFIRTSPAHGTAFDIAGRSLADPGSMKAAIIQAMEIM